MKLKSEFDTPNVEKVTPKYRERHNEIKRLSHSIKKADGVQRELLLEEYSPKRKQLMCIPCTSQTDKRIKYIRYADDFLIAVKGSREDCQLIKSKLTEYIGHTLKMERSEEKTLITHSSESARFLWFGVRVRRSGAIKRGGNGNVKKRTLNGSIELLIAQKPKIFDAFLQLMQGTGYEIKSGKHYAFKGAEQKKFIRTLYHFTTTIVFTVVIETDFRDYFMGK